MNDEDQKIAAEILGSQVAAKLLGGPGTDTKMTFSPFFRAAMLAKMNHGKPLPEINGVYLKLLEIAGQGKVGAAKLEIQLVDAEENTLATIVKATIGVRDSVQLFNLHKTFTIVLG